MAFEPLTQPRTCSIAATLDVIGEKWALLAVREVFLGARRFDEIVRNTGAPRDTMTNRLRTLVEQGVLAKRRYNERPPREEYVLTSAGRDLYPVLITMLQWGDRHRPSASGRPMVLRHECGHLLTPVLTCQSCDQPVTLGSSTPERPRRRLAKQLAPVAG